MPSRRDEERLEEEIAGAERAARPRSLSGEYLMQALEGLHDAGDPAVLFDHWRRFPPKKSASAEGKMQASARRRRVRAARTAVLFAALALESYVNEFLRAHLDDKQDWRAIERMRTEDKIFVGTRLVYGERIFFRDREDSKPLIDLLELRNRLVHAKPGFGVTGVHGEVGADFEALFALPTVADYIVAVGGFADAVVRRAYGFHDFDVPGTVIWQARDVICDFARRHAELPSWNAPAERPLFRQAGDHVMATEPLPDHPDASWTRLRQAREAKDRQDASDTP